jgi:hypothetical protein
MQCDDLPDEVAALIAKNGALTMEQIYQRDLLLHGVRADTETIDDAEWGCEVDSGLDAFLDRTAARRQRAYDHQARMVGHLPCDRRYSFAAGGSLLVLDSDPHS